ncbi:hypothetical protein LTR04_003284 [Oleoguttula sp. CCFEE 6159]|nr:hypothetical protein LTR04_003284 [Oleoguttula sp. CCFEE 6159]
MNTAPALRSFAVCQLCQPAARAAVRRQWRYASTAAALPTTSRPQQQNAQRGTGTIHRVPRNVAQKEEARVAQQSLARRKGEEELGPGQNRTAPSRTAVVDAEHVRTIQRIDGLAKEILSSEAMPSEEAVMKVLEQCTSVARALVGHEEESSPTPQVTTSSSNTTTTAASSLLSLDARRPSSVSAAQLIAHLSDLAYRLLTHPPVFITSQILAAYTTLQSLLQRPSTLAEIFHLYAYKPVPRPNTSPPTYSTPNPRKVSAAIPTTVANTALTAAIRAHDLLLALSLVETSFRAPAFRRSKMLRRAAPPLLGFALAPLAAWAGASQLATYQSTMDPSHATGLAFAGILTYIGATATVGAVAVTTSNDQMDRVTWATGMPLRERWIREEERAAIDRVAGAWGFADAGRRGEEEGAEWEGLREWIGVRGMVLDRVELMEGME